MNMPGRSDLAERAFVGGARPAPHTAAGGRRPASSHRVGRREVALYAAAMLAMASIRIALIGGPQFFNDSYQYLSIVESLRARSAIDTSIVHFDEERARGHIPAQETTFPPGYPLLMWSLAWTPLSPELIGLLISLASALGVVWLLWSAGTELGLSPTGMRGALIAWAFSAQASLYAVTLYAEAVFTFVTLAAILLALQAVRLEHAARMTAALLAAGVSFWLRYAGLFLVIALHLFVGAELVRRRRRVTAWLLSLVACDSIVALLMARNLRIAGVWSGGNSRPVHHSAASVLHGLGVSAYELVLGSIHDPRSLPFGAFVLLVAAGGLATSIACLGAVKRARTSPVRSNGMLLLAYCVVYCGGVTYAGFSTQISLSARMFVPLVPVVLLWAALLVSGIEALSPSFWTRAHRVAAGILAAGYVGSNVQSAIGPQRIPEYRVVTEALALPMRGGEPLLVWLAKKVPRDGVLMAVDGQATGYVLKRKTISVVGRAFTTATWEQDEVHRAVSQFGVSHVIVYRDVVATGGIDSLDSSLFRDLVARRPPVWLELAAENPRVLVYATRAER